MNGWGWGLIGWVGFLVCVALLLAQRYVTVQREIEAEWRAAGDRTRARRAAEARRWGEGMDAGARMAEHAAAQRAQATRPGRETVQGEGLNLMTASAKELTRAFEGSVPKRQGKGKGRAKAPAGAATKANRAKRATGQRRKPPGRTGPRGRGGSKVHK